MDVVAYRASILHFTSKPSVSGEGVHFFEDGVLVVSDGKVVCLGEYKVLLPSLADIEIMDFSGYLIMPGFIDTHIHYPQTDVIASYGQQLLDWLNNYTFKAEQKFCNYEYSRQVSDFFLNEITRNGTTTAMVFCTQHKTSVDVFFETARSKGMCMIAGKVLMDRNAPSGLLDDCEQGAIETQQLIDDWHGVDRLFYALTPRFAPTSSKQQLRSTGELVRNNPTVYLQTHIAENKHEVDWVRSLFPEHKSYLDVYDHYGLLYEKSILAHGIHLTDESLRRLSETKSTIAFCPTSNLFLGSGLYDLEKHENFGVKTSIATDVGAGTTFSMLKTLGEAYKVCQLKGYSLHPFEAFYRITLGNAEALHLSDQLGNFESGKFADFILLDFHCTPLMSYRYDQCSSLEEKLFLMMICGDDRNIKNTYIKGLPCQV